MKEMGRVNQSASEGLYSMESVKANAMEDEFCAAYGASLEELYQKKKKLTKTTTLLTLPSVFCAFGMQITILIVGGFLTATGRITAGELVTMISLMSFIVDPVMCLENTVVALHAYRVSLDALESYLDETAPPPSEAKRLTGDVCVSFKNVSFAYPGGKDILHGMTFCLAPREDSSAPRRKRFGQEHARAPALRHAASAEGRYRPHGHRRKNAPAAGL